MSMYSINTSNLLKVICKTSRVGVFFFLSKDREGVICPAVRVRVDRGRFPYVDNDNNFVIRLYFCKVGALLNEEETFVGDSYVLQDKACELLPTHVFEALQALVDYSVNRCKVNMETPNLA